MDYTKNTCLAWLGLCRKTSKTYGALPNASPAFLLLAMISYMSKRIAQ
ncbi:hypothetical protein NEOC95_000903 [Neochlamydia sp. AcF95]|nr:hypothetical protein [Neochlamydia sp. AcF95]